MAQDVTGQDEEISTEVKGSWLSLTNSVLELFIGIRAAQWWQRCHLSALPALPWTWNHRWWSFSHSQARRGWLRGLNFVRKGSHSSYGYSSVARLVQTQCPHFQKYFTAMAMSQREKYYWRMYTMATLLPSTATCCNLWFLGFPDSTKGVFRASWWP